MKLTKDQIDEVFETATDQTDAVIGIFKIVFPEWDNITSVGGYPHVSSATSEYIFAKAMAFDKEHHPDVIAGGAWLNYGFSAKDGVEDWVVDTSECNVELKPVAVAA